MNIQTMSTRWIMMDLVGFAALVVSDGIATASYLRYLVPLVVTGSQLKVQVLSTSNRINTRHIPK